jgi:anaerobic selenocysteine-containing dehydrogenase/Fe-S-cluster-containing dehydrogenase component
MEGDIAQMKAGQKSSEEALQNVAGGGLVQISRRRFLQVLGATSAVGAAACANPADQKILPYVKPDPEQIPGVAVWYSSTCTECSAGCGIRVRTREGRAVKVEGNPNSPVNRGGLCALGQASLQALYDPDRVREPQKKTSRGIEKERLRAPTSPVYSAVSWDDAYEKVTDAISKAANKKVLLTGELTSAQAELVDSFVSQLGFTHIMWDPTQPVAVARAAELVYGTYGVPTFAIDKAQVVVNFGADFLETWGNPVGYARQWADSRRSEQPLRFVHVEPRLSLTGANADLWLKSAVGSEVRIALFLISELMKRGRTKGLSEDTKAKIARMTTGVSVEAVSQETGVSTEKLLLVAQYLADSESSLVLAGGAATQTRDPLPLLVAVNILNVMLGNVGKTVDVATTKKPESSAAAVAGLIDDMKAGKVDVLLTYNTNPQFTFPAAYGFGYAANEVGVKGEGTGKKAGLVVALSSHLDETAELADYVLPVHTGLEDWGYVKLPDGSISLMQPSMRPIFSTKSFGDVLFDIAAGASKTLAGDNKTFDAFVKSGYLKACNGKVGADAEKFWMSSLEKGGFFQEAAAAKVAGVPAVNASVFSMSFGIETPRGHGSSLVLYPYPSVKSFDGRAANRPWLQELADPITQAVWGAWAEIHPDTAKDLNIAQGDAVILRTADGEVHVPAYVTEHVHKGMVAVPIGQGHSAYGRFAKSAAEGSGSVYSLLPKLLAKDTDALVLTGTEVSVKRALGRGNLVTVQEFASQENRELARTTMLVAGTAGAAAHAHAGDPGEAHGTAHGGGHDGGHGGGHHEPKQMYEQREHPLYQWGLAVDLAACTGCSACVVACSAENNIPVVGKKVVSQGREMAWLRIERYYDSIRTEDGGEELKVSFLPMMCQHCQNAPCEPVCPVYATYHNEEGMNAMIYNRCVGTRYCSNNCSYKVRRFNWFQYEWPELLDWQVNPDVTKRTVGVMEKCTFCVQRIAEAKDVAKDLGRLVEDGDVTPACVQTCPTQALTFGNLKDPNSRVSKAAKSERAYKVLDHHLNTQPSVSYLNDIRYKA